MIVEILAIGTEVVDGDVVNTNAAWLSRQMGERGFQVRFHTTVPDDEALMLDALSRASTRAQVVLVTGGLGPTVDDFTIEIAAKFFGVPLTLHPESLEKIRGFFQKFKRPMSQNQERQAMLPQGGTPLSNDFGTAPGVYVLHQNVHYAFFPGVPKEMQEMFRAGLLPLLPKPTQGGFQMLKTLRCFGLPEGQMDAELRAFMQGRGEMQGVQVGFRVRFPTIDIRLKATDLDPHAAESRIEAASRVIREKLGDHVFGADEDSLEALVGGLLKEKGFKIATAESCTGGLLASLITDVSGASEYFLAGLVTYSNEAKIKLLEVAAETIQNFGAVSSETALEMARGIRKISGADFGVSLTGIAGPSGGTTEKPVGTVHIAVVHPDGEWEKAYLFPFGRERFKQVAAATALDRLRRILQSKLL